MIWLKKCGALALRCNFGPSRNPAKFVKDQDISSPPRRESSRRCLALQLPVGDLEMAESGAGGHSGNRAGLPRAGRKNNPKNSAGLPRDGHKKNTK
jgi:hypothetical protein